MQTQIELPNGIAAVAFWLLIGFIVIQLFYFLYFYLRAVRWKNPGKTESEPVSILVCARNEEKNLMELIPVLMDQDYPDFEVVVINDNSWDDSKEILKAYQLQYPNLIVRHLSEEKQRMQGKKFALTIAIKAACNERLALIDADCIPQSRNWLSYLCTHSEGKEIVLGYGPFEKSKGLLNSLVRFETLQTALSYLGFARAGIPYMGVGRNLSYTKSSFFSVGGFKSHLHYMSGDDDLFINQVATAKNTAIQIHPDSHTLSKSKKSWKEWLHQKRRHLTTGKEYKFKHKFLLALFPLTYILMILMVIINLGLHTAYLLVIVPLALRYLCQFAIFRASAKHLGNRDLSWLAFFYELLLLAILIVLSIRNRIAKPKSWQ